ncbi:MAG: hypothetical protein IKD69_05705 [Solobacterium sp.]|nr:hypothetical protein [Solobacterium sp.]
MLRRLRREDLPLLEGILANNPSYYPDYLPQSKEAYYSKMLETIDRFYNDFFVIDDNGVKGFVGTSHYRPQDANIRLFVFTGEKELRRATMLEMKEYLCANLPLKKIYVQVKEDDAMMIEICSEMMEQEACLKEYLYFNGTYQDLMIFGWKL